MAKDIDLEVKEILGEINEVNSKNEQKVVAVASWNGREDTIDIRRYNVIDEILTKGISLTPEEAAETLYILLSNPIYVKYDREKVYQILKEQEESEINVAGLVEKVELAEGITNEEEENESEQLQSVAYGNLMGKVPVKSSHIKIYPKSKDLFTKFYK